jgi:SAM-dependent methyltransferase
LRYCGINFQSLFNAHRFSMTATNSIAWQFWKRLNPQVLRRVDDEIQRFVGRANLGADARLLDVGCWDGEATLRYARVARIAAENTYGVEVCKEALADAAGKIRATRLDIEREPLPYPDSFFDVVVTNQVFEHLKQIYFPMDEIARVLRPGGHFIFSVPNVASLHNRLLLALGRQPTSIRVFGPHVRAFTAHEARLFIELNSVFKVFEWVGVGFYPFPMPVARPLSWLFPGLSHTPVFHAIKLAHRAGPGWANEVERHVQTQF